MRRDNDWIEVTYSFPDKYRNYYVISALSSPIPLPIPIPFLDYDKTESAPFKCGAHQGFFVWHNGGTSDTTLPTISIICSVLVFVTSVTWGISRVSTWFKNMHRRSSISGILPKQTAESKPGIEQQCLLILLGYRPEMPKDTVEFINRYRIES
jgi:hypothetical protein